jgi:hypothetical protein
VRLTVVLDLFVVVRLMQLREPLHHLTLAVIMVAAGGIVLLQFKMLVVFTVAGAVVVAARRHQAIAFGALLEVLVALTPTT